jgi:hypothetical protein
MTRQGHHSSTVAERHRTGDYREVKPFEDKLREECAPFALVLTSGEGSTSGPTTTSAFRPARMNTAICFRTASERMCSRWGDGKRYRWLAFSAITTIEAGHLRMDRITTAESPVPKQKAGPGSRRSHVQIVRPDQGYDQCLGTVLRAHKATHSFLYYGPAGASELTHELLRRNRLHANVMVRKCI